VVIIDASTDGDNITYTIQNPKLTENATFEDVSLFVDGNGGNNCDTIYLDTNGVTIKACSGARPGDIGVLNGVGYLVVDNVRLDEMSADNEDLTNVVITLVTDMSGVNISFNPDISSWDTSNVTDMSGIFGGASTFNQNISTWDTSNVTDMSGMFDGLESGGTSFNQDISSWDTSNVTNMNAMFRYATSFNQNLSSWDVSKVTDCPGFSASTTSWILPKPNFTNCDPN
jgi:surface protein